MTNGISASSPQPPAGWYPDPSGRPGQMYWDGQRWRTDTPPPAAPSTPWQTDRPTWEKGRGFWSGLSRKAKIILAGGAGLVVAIVVVMIGTSTSGPSGQPSPGQPASGSHSSAYNQGYEWGNQHMGTEGISEDTFVAFGCAQDFRRQYLKSQLTNEGQDDWLQGCRDGLSAALKTGKSSTP